MQNKEPKLYIKILMYSLLFIISLGLIILGGRLKELSAMSVIRLSSCVIFGNILVLFGFSAGAANTALYGDNVYHLIRFLIIYDLCLICSFGFTFLPIGAWPFTAIFAVLVLMSNLPTGIVASTICLTISISFSIQEYNSYFLLYFLCGIMTVILLGHLDEQFRIGLPLLISEVVLLTGLFIIVFTENGSFSLEILVYPLINVTISLILLFFVLKIYSSKVVFVKSDIYLDINDPEATLLSELKNIAPDDYFKSIHVAYFCERLAVKLGLDPNVLKCAGYYHRVGTISGDNSWENTYSVCSEVGLPDEVVDILSEFLATNVRVTKAETAVLYMSECIISSILFLFSKDKDMQLDLQNLIEAIFKHRIETGIFNNCEITMKQFEDMKTVFVEENLYYDFLR